MLTETWLHKHLDAEINIEKYSIFRVDRSRPKKKRGRCSGGVAVYIREDIAAGTEILFQYSCGVIEAIGLMITSLNLFVSVVYRQPDDQAGGNHSTSIQFDRFLEQVRSTVSSLPQPTPNIVIAGDFNLPHATWSPSLQISGAPPEERRMLQSLDDLCTEHFLQQMVHEPTHRAGNTLDLVLTNNPDIFMSVKCSPTTPISSHSLVKLEAILSAPDNVQDNPRDLASEFDKVNLIGEDVNWAGIREEIDNTNWLQITENRNASQILDNILETCRKIVSIHAPKKAKSRNRKSGIPRHRRTLMRKRTRLRKRFQIVKQPTQKSNIERRLTDIEYKLQESYRSQESYLEEKAVDSIKANPKYFYAYARKKSKIHIPVGPLTDSQGNVESSPGGMAELLSNQYQTAFSTPATTSLNLENPIADTLSDLNFSENDITKAIEEVSYNAAPGPDRFPATLLKNCKHQLAKPLYLLWRRSLDFGEVPEKLKTSAITPIHKGGSRKYAKNYRPVALTSHIIKVFEKVIRNKVVRFIESRNLMNPNQHGFRAGHSCLTQLIQHHDKITKLLEEGMNVDVVYVDFAKAFDKLDIDITLQKLHELGITGKVFEWIKAFLSERRQYVVVEGSKSEPVPVISGVPQGSVLGPLMFLILLGDIDENIRYSHVASFADDTRIFSGIGSNEDVNKLQADLENIYEWARSNNATFNSEKFECMRYGPNCVIRENTNYTSDDGTPISEKENVKDLGVILSKDATFSTHISALITSANLKCGWILRTFKTRDRLPLLTLWKSLVAPIIDYCCQLWSPSSLGTIQKLEGVLHSYLRKVSGLERLDYWEQLKTIKMYSQQRRRERYICIYTWKVLENIVPNFGIESTYSGRRGRNCVVPLVRTASSRIKTIRFTSMGVNGPRLFNHLPQSLRDMSGCSVDTFKRALDNHLDTIPDEPRIPRLVKYCSKANNSLLEY